MGAFKTVGFSRTGKKGGPFIDSIGHRNYSKAYVSSNNDILYYAEAFGIEEHRVIPTGVPRTDVLFDESYKTRIKQSLETKLPIIKIKKSFFLHLHLEEMDIAQHTILSLKLILQD